MTLIPNWRRAWRLSSVRAAIALLMIALQSLLEGLNADVLPLAQPLISPRAWPWVAAGFAAAIIVLRVLRQIGALDPSEAAPERQAGAEREP